MQVPGNPCIPGTKKGLVDKNWQVTIMHCFFLLTLSCKYTSSKKPLRSRQNAEESIDLVIPSKELKKGKRQLEAAGFVIVEFFVLF